VDCHSNGVLLVMVLEMTDLTLHLAVRCLQSHLHIFP
jgi:hypothetical protein